MPKSTKKAKLAQRKEAAKRKAQSCVGCKKHFKRKFDFQMHMRLFKKNCAHLIPMRQTKNSKTLNIKRGDKWIVEACKDGKNRIYLSGSTMKRRFKLTPDHVMTKAFMYFGNLVWGSGKEIQVYVHKMNDGLVVQPHEMYNKMEFENFFGLPRSCTSASKELGFDKSKFAVKLFY